MWYAVTQWLSMTAAATNPQPTKKIPSTHSDTLFDCCCCYCCFPFTSITPFNKLNLIAEHQNRPYFPTFAYVRVYRQAGEKSLTNWFCSANFLLSLSCLDLSATSAAARTEFRLLLFIFYFSLYFWMEAAGSRNPPIIQNCYVYACMVMKAHYNTLSYNNLILYIHRKTVIWRKNASSHHIWRRRVQTVFIRTEHQHQQNRPSSLPLFLLYGLYMLLILILSFFFITVCVLSWFASPDLRYSSFNKLHKSHWHDLLGAKRSVVLLQPERPPAMLFFNSHILNRIFVSPFGMYHFSHLVVRFKTRVHTTDDDDDDVDVDDDVQCSDLIKMLRKRHGTSYGWWWWQQTAPYGACVGARSDAISQKQINMSSDVKKMLTHYL